jgi:hypothetical protein
MKSLKFFFVIALVVCSGSCASWIPKTTYYYMVSSGCTKNGVVMFLMPNGGRFTSQNNSIYNYVTKAYKFKTGEPLFISASIFINSARDCQRIPITVTIMKGESPEGSIGSGGNVWATATRAGSIAVNGTAN